MKSSTRKNTVATLAALTLLGSVTGCASTTTGAVGSTGGGSTSDAPYADGTYEASGNYQSPHGTETVDVTLTLKGDVITAVDVVGQGDNPDSMRYQGEFIGGIGAEVVGKNIDELSVDRVAGSSLTSGGFNDAIEQIKADALA